MDEHIGTATGLNKIHHIDNREGMAALPEKCAALIIADPPYFEVKGDFDFVWKSFDEYLEFMEEQAVAYKRILAENGTLYVYGHSKKIAYVQVIFDKYFGLVNNLVWDKGSFMGLENSEGLRSFAPCSERLLMYANKGDMTGLQAIEKEFVAPRNPFAIELKKARLKKGVGINEVAEYGHFYGNVNHGGAVTNWENGYNVPLPEQWKILCANLPIERQEYEELRQEYEELRQEYEELRRPFDNIYSQREIIKFSNEAMKTGALHDHDTVKPTELSNCLVLTSSRKGDLVVIPFAGSGSECVAAKKKGRDFIGFETTLKYVEMANERVRKETAQISMF